MAEKCERLPSILPVEPPDVLISWPAEADRGHLRTLSAGPREYRASATRTRRTRSAGSSMVDAQLPELKPRLRHRAGSHVPHVGRVFGDRPIAREVAGRGNVEDCLRRPALRVAPQR